MNANIDHNDTQLHEEWGERISAYVDNELGPEEHAEVDRLLQTSEAARRLADDFRQMRSLCQQDAAPTFQRDLSRDVVAEALRRQASGETDGQVRVDVSPLEPEGDFGLPFGKTSRGWAWAAVAAAAALMIGFYGRTPARGPIGSVDQSVAAIQRAVPGLQVVDVETTPDRWRQVYGQQLQPVANRELPVALASAKRSGLQLETDMPARDAQDQLLYLPGGFKQAESLREALHQVGPDLSNSQPAAKPTGAKQAVPAMRIVIRGKPGEPPKVLIPTGQQQTPAIGSADSTRPIVVRVRIRAN